MDATEDAGAPIEYQESIEDVTLPGTLGRLKEFIDSDNVAELLDKDTLLAIGKQVCEDYDTDKGSCGEWYEQNARGLELARQVSKKKSFPWEGAANVVVPLITSAVIAYNARVMPEIIRNGGVAQTRILGRDDGSKAARAERVKAHLDYQLLFQMTEWEEDTDKLLMVVATSGVAYRKAYYDPIKKRNCSTILTPDQVIVNNGIQSLDTARRVSHLFQMVGNEIESKKRAGLFREVELSAPSGGKDNQPEDDPMYNMIEQHRWLDLDQDGYEEPYTVTVDKDSQEVMRIVCRYDERDITYNEDDGEVVAIHARNHFIDYHFVPSFDGSFLSVGFGILLGGLNKASNSVLNALLNAGMLSNTQGGFLAKGFRMQGGNKPLAAGEYRKTEVPAEILDKSVYPLPVKEPSAVLAQLLEFLIGQAQGIVSVQAIGLDQMPANAPGVSVLSVMEQASKTFNATFKRFYRSLTKELRLYADLNRRYLPDEEYFRLQDGEQSVARDDYATEDFDIIPVADPSITTQAQRMAIANSTFEIAKNVPGSNVVEAGREVLKAIGHPDPDSIIPPAGEQTIPPEVQQQMGAMQQQMAQMQQLLQQAGQEMAMLNVMLANKSDGNKIKAFTAYWDAEVKKTTAIKNLAEAQAKGDQADIARFEAEVAAASSMSKSLEGIINARNAAGSVGMVGAPGNESAQGMA